MATRRPTIKKDPLAAAATPPDAAIVGGKTPRVATVRSAAAAATAPAATATVPATTAVAAPHETPSLMSRSCAAVVGLGNALSHRMTRQLDPSKALGGKMELLGGALGPGWAFIRRVGPEGRLGFLTGEGFVDLETQLRAIRTAPDHAEHRVLSVIGWGWVVGSLFGPAGAIVAGGVRLMIPTLTLVELTLRDGRSILARTDGVTATALSHLPGMPSWQEVAVAA